MNNPRTWRKAIRYALAALLFGLGCYTVAWGAKESCSCQAIPAILGGCAALLLWTLALIMALRTGALGFWACAACGTKNEETRSECAHCGQRRT